MYGRQKSEFQEYFRRFLPICSLLLLGLMWGGAVNGAKYVSLNGVSPFSYIFWVMATAGVVFFTINLIRGIYPPLRHIRIYLICGTLGLAIPQYFMFDALKSIPAGIMTLFIATTPFLTYVFSMAMRAEQHHVGKTIGVIFGFCGTALIVLPSVFGFESVPAGKILVAVLTPVSYACFTTFIAVKRPGNLDLLPILTGMSITCTVVLLFVVSAIEPIYPLWKHLNLVSVLILYHGIVTAIAYAIFFTLIKNSGPLFASQATYFVTIFGIVIGAIAYNEVLPITVWCAAVLIFTGLGFIQRAKAMVHSKIV